jgi:hypothetical protein
VVTLVGQRVFAIALGYEDLNDHDELRHDPIMAVLTGKLKARRENCAPVAGPDQGVPARSLFRSHVDGHHAGQSATSLVLFDGLRADVRLAAHWLR